MYQLEVECYTVHSSIVINRPYDCVPDFEK